MFDVFTEVYVVGDDLSERVVAKRVLIDELEKLHGIHPPSYAFDPRDGKLRMAFRLQSERGIAKVNRYLQGQLGDTLLDVPPLWLQVETSKRQSEGEHEGRDTLSEQVAAFLKSTLNMAWGKFKGSARTFLERQKEKAIKRIG